MAQGGVKKAPPGVKILSIDAKDIYISNHYIHPSEVGYNIRNKDGDIILKKFLFSFQIINFFILHFINFVIKSCGYFDPIIPKGFFQCRSSILIPNAQVYSFPREFWKM